MAFAWPGASVAFQRHAKLAIVHMYSVTNTTCTKLTSQQSVVSLAPAFLPLCQSLAVRSLSPAEFVYIFCFGFGCWFSVARNPFRVKGPPIKKSSQRKAKLEEMEGNMRSGRVDGATDQWRVHDYITCHLEHGPYLRLMVQAAAGTRRATC
eukprot:2072443-Karenia_brevis.AAC.1